MLLSELYGTLQERLADAAKNADKMPDVANDFEVLLNEMPGDPGILFHLGTAKLHLGLNGSAIAYLNEASVGAPDAPEIWNNLGSAWKAENHEDVALEMWQKALEIDERADFYSNIATLYVNSGKPAEGLEYVNRALELDPQHWRAKWNKSLMLLEMGLWKEGFELYDAGLYSDDRPIRNYSNDQAQVPLWTGEQATVVCYGEQGVGDELMFASCIPDMKKECDLILDCHPRLKTLFERSFGVRCYGTRKEMTIQWPHEDPPEFKVPIGSLFRLYRPTGEFPKKPYLKADPEKVKKYRARLEAAGPGPYIGLGWIGGTKKTRADYRSVKLGQLRPILDQGGTFISLQYTDVSDKCERFFQDTGIRVHHWPEVVESGPAECRNIGYDYDETAALVEALDLVIAINTTVVHLCGALGKTCFTMTPDAAAWRYQLEGDEMPMYGPWVKQFRGDERIALVAREYCKWRTSAIV